MTHLFKSYKNFEYLIYNKTKSKNFKLIKFKSKRSLGLVMFFE